jgi:hypothetical protein
MSGAHCAWHVLNTKKIGINLWKSWNINEHHLGGTSNFYASCLLYLQTILHIWHVMYVYKYIISFLEQIAVNYCLFVLYFKSSRGILYHLANQHRYGHPKVSGGKRFANDGLSQHMLVYWRVDLKESMARFAPGWWGLNPQPWIHVSICIDQWKVSKAIGCFKFIKQAWTLNLKLILHLVGTSWSIGSVMAGTGRTKPSPILPYVV